MDQSGIADRRRLRRKLTFWRLAAFVLVALGIVAYGYLHSGRDPHAVAHVARVSVEGLITDDDDLIGRLDAIAGDAAAKALIVSINSPGGTTFGGQQIYEAVRRVAEKKPVLAEIRTLGASAAYMVAIAGDHIVADDTSIVGSIGVIFQYPQVAGLLDKLGVAVNEIKSAPLKGEPSPFHPPSAGAEAMIRSVILDSYDWFVDLVAKRRKLPHDKALALADGRVFTGRQAVAAGLVDSLGGEAAAREWLAARGVAKTLPIVDWPRSESGGFPFLARASALIFQGFAGSAAGGAAGLAELGGSKLFLDGLLSVWQFGVGPTMAE